MANPNHHAGEEIRITNIDVNLKQTLVKFAKEKNTTLSRYLKRNLQLMVEESLSEDLIIKNLDPTTKHKIEQCAWKKGITVSNFIQENIHKLIQ